MSAAVIRARADEHHTGSEAIDQLSNPARVANVEGPLADVNPALTTEASVATRMTALMRASCDGSVEEVRLLLRSGTDVNAKRTDGFTALALAAFFGHALVVRLLLEGGADVEDKGRCETSAEMWATARGFLGISDFLREARAKTLLAVSPPVVSKLHEHPGSVQQAKREDSKESLREPLQPAHEEAEITVESKAIAAGVSDEQKCPATPDLVVSVNTLGPDKQIVIERKSAAHRMLPEIVDLPPVAAPEFRPGVVFLTRITSSWKNLTALTLAVMIICGLVTFAAFKMSRALTSDPGQPATVTTAASALPADTNDTGAPPEQSIPEQANQTLATAPDDASDAHASNVTDGSSTDSDKTDPASNLEPDEVRQTTSPSVAKNRKSDRVTRAAVQNRISESSSSRQVSVVTPTVFRPSPSSQKRGPASANAVPKRQVVVDAAPKPAPFTVESTRTRTTSSATERRSETPNSPSPPLGVTSGKPKSKVIQWP